MNDDASSDGDEAVTEPPSNDEAETPEEAENRDSHRRLPSAEERLRRAEGPEWGRFFYMLIKGSDWY